MVNRQDVNVETKITEMVSARDDPSHTIFKQIDSLPRTLQVLRNNQAATPC